MHFCHRQTDNEIVAQARDVYITSRAKNLFRLCLNVLFWQAQPNCCDSEKLDRLNRILASSSRCMSNESMRCCIPQSVIVFLACSVPQRQFHRSFVDLNVGHVVLKDCRHILLWKLVLAEDDQQARLTTFSIADHHQLPPYLHHTATY